MGIVNHGRELKMQFDVKKIVHNRGQMRLSLLHEYVLLISWLFCVMQKLYFKRISLNFLC